MPALNFKKQFAAAVESGRKTQTIRAFRKYPIKIGDDLYLYTGMRTKSCRKLADAICTSTSNIEIDSQSIAIDGLGVTGRVRNDIARRDGFDCFETMAEWFDETHGLPFRGHIIYWMPVS